MNAEFVTVELAKGRSCKIPNRWSHLTKESFLNMVELLGSYASGSISIEDITPLYLANFLRYSRQDFEKLSAAGMENFYTIASQIDFIERYDTKRSQLVLRAPRFARQFIPTLSLCGKLYAGYNVTIASDMLSTDLTALEFLDAYQCVGRVESLPLLAMILYRRDRSIPYNADAALREAAAIDGKLSKEEVKMLTAVSVQFSAFAAYLFSIPSYSPLTAAEPRSRAENAIEEGATAALYSLCRDGLGSAVEMERMPILKYLELLVNKLIDGVHTLDAAGLDKAEIANKTRLPIDIISRILD